jgi:NAD(P)-dependent dehydrogenase (short-subunit alcohol dehydrogenase family)
MARKYVVTGAASGIGQALTEQLRGEGHTVYGVDLRGADVNVDLTTAEGRAALVTEVTELSGGAIDAVVAVAGLAAPIPATAGVNYFGTIATLEGLRPLLARAPLSSRLSRRSSPPTSRYSPHSAPATKRPPSNSPRRSPTHRPTPRATRSTTPASTQSRSGCARTPRPRNGQVRASRSMRSHPELSRPR